MHTHAAPNPPLSQPATTSLPLTDPAVGDDRHLLRLGAVIAVVGLTIQVPLGFLHPHHADPNDSTRAFTEYAESTDWVPVHIGQFIGALLITLSLVALGRHLSRGGGIDGALGVLGGAAAIVVAAVFAVQMAVDGVALKGAINAWTITTNSTDRTAAFLVADGIRSVEKALSALFLVGNGFTLVALGLALAIGRLGPRWLGWLGTTTGLVFLVEGVIVANTGFSAPAATVALIPTVLLPIFLLGTAFTMWRSAFNTARS